MVTRNPINILYYLAGDCGASEDSIVNQRINRYALEAVKTACHPPLIGVSEDVLATNMRYYVQLLLAGFIQQIGAVMQPALTLQNFSFQFSKISSQDTRVAEAIQRVFAGFEIQVTTDQQIQNIRLQLQLAGFASSDSEAINNFLRLVLYAAQQFTGLPDTATTAQIIDSLATKINNPAMLANASVMIGYIFAIDPYKLIAFGTNPFDELYELSKIAAAQTMADAHVNTAVALGDEEWQCMQRALQPKGVFEDVAVTRMRAYLQLMFAGFIARIAREMGENLPLRTEFTPASDTVSAALDKVFATHWSGSPSLQRLNSLLRYSNVISMKPDVEFLLSLLRCADRQLTRIQGNPPLKEILDALPQQIGNALNVYPSAEAIFSIHRSQLIATSSTLAVAHDVSRFGSDTLIAGFFDNASSTVRAGMTGWGCCPTQQQPVPQEPDDSFDLLMDADETVALLRKQQKQCSHWACWSWGPCLLKGLRSAGSYTTRTATRAGIGATVTALLQVAVQGVGIAYGANYQGVIVPLQRNRSFGTPANSFWWFLERYPGNLLFSRWLSDEHYKLHHEPSPLYITVFSILSVLFFYYLLMFVYRLKVPSLESRLQFLEEA